MHAHIAEANGEEITQILRTTVPAFRTTMPEFGLVEIAKIEHYEHPAIGRQSIVEGQARDANEQDRAYPLCFIVANADQFDPTLAHIERAARGVFN